MCEHVIKPPILPAKNYFPNCTISANFTFFFLFRFASHCVNQERNNSSILVITRETKTGNDTQQSVYLLLGERKKKTQQIWSRAGRYLIQSRKGTKRCISGDKITRGRAVKNFSEGIGLFYCTNTKECNVKKSQGVSTDEFFLVNECKVSYQRSQVSLQSNRDGGDTFMY